MTSELSKSYPVQNAYSDRFLHLLNGEEWKVMVYVLRRTLGKGKPHARISLNEFAYGWIEEGERQDFGTGLSVSTIEKTVRNLRGFGILIEARPPVHAKHLGAAYRIEEDLSRVDSEALEDRRARQYQVNEARTEKARLAKAAKDRTGDEQAAPTVAQYPTKAPTVTQGNRVLSDSETAHCRTVPAPTVAQYPIKETNHQHDLSNKDNGRGAPVGARPRKRRSGEKKARDPDPRSQHAAILSVNALVEKFRLPLALYDDVIAAIGENPNESKLAANRKEWLKRGHNPAGWAWAMDWYTDGIPERGGNPNGRGQKIVGSAAPTPGKYANRR